jgi:hypothetical protein
MLTKNKWRYLGDGVYAMWDGYHIWLHTGAHDNPDNKVALDPEVQVGLTEMFEAIVNTPIAKASGR